MVDKIESEFTKNIYSSRDLRLAHKDFLMIWPKLKEEFGLDTGFCLEISCTYRSPKAQMDVYKLGREMPGRKVTDCDGWKKLSKHNKFPSEAIDVWCHLGGKQLAIWDYDVFHHLGPICKQMGLIWGGNFKIVDPCHIELPEKREIGKNT